MNHPLQAWRDAYAQVAGALSATERAPRDAHLQAFMDAGFPDKTQEDWRYTDLSPLAAQTFVPALAADAGLPQALRLQDADLLHFVNGVPAGSIPDGVSTSAAAPQPDAEDGLLHLNAAFARHGLQLHVPRNTRRERTLQVITTLVPAAATAMNHLAHRIELEAGAEATVVFLNHADGDGAHFETQTLTVRLHDGARLNLVRIQDAGNATTLLRLDADVGRDAAVHCTGLDLGGALVRNDLNFTLTAPGAQLRLDGVFAPAGRTHVDNHTRIVHAAPHGTSRETFRGLIADRARAVFNGKVVVKPGAQKTDSEQHVASLLLSPQAEVDAKPELEIYADDVKCAHGATVGQLDDDMVYYLRSRGLSYTEARNLLLFTFAHQVLGGITDPALRRLAEAALLQRLPGGADLQELVT